MLRQKSLEKKRMATTSAQYRRAWKSSHPASLFCISMVYCTCCLLLAERCYDNQSKELTCHRLGWQSACLTCSTGSKAFILWQLIRQINSNYTENLIYALG